MNEEYSESSIDDSEKEKDSISRNENLFDERNEYFDCSAPITDGLDYEAISEKFEVDPNNLTIKEPIGKGYFSDVHMGMLSLPTGKIPVAVKTPQMKTSSMNAEESEGIIKRQRRALRDELRIFAHLQSSSTGGHGNVLKLLGAITTIRTDFSLLTEYCECGSMDRFLQAKWKNGAFEDELVLEANENDQVWKIQCDSSWGEHYQSRRENGLITTSDLLWFALQIARAMKFLAAMNVIHRDIALRNVLLKSDFTLKVADFGLSRKLRDNDDAYYILNKETALPVRYIAPETLNSGRFSITSEYWSFGIVLWELFTFAEQQPYTAEFDRYESNVLFYDFMKEHLLSGCRLSIPNNVPQQIKSLLARLWHSEPKRRPSFQVCGKVIRQELMQSCPNVRKIFKLAIPYENVTDLGNATAQFYLGVTYDIGQGVNQSDEKAVQWYRQAAKQGSTGAQNNLGEMYLKGRGVLQSDEEAVKWYRNAAEQGNAIAQFNLGLMYQNGRGVHQSDEEAVKWIKKAAEQGDANAQTKLGFMYQNGRGVSQSNEEAVKWIKKAAEQGNASGQANFGWMYQFGLGILQSDEEAVKWYRKSADQGDANAQDSLGFMYLNGRGVPQSDEEAVKWFRKAAEQGYVEDQFNLGFMYQNGFGVPQSYDEAAKWYRKAVEQKDAMAQFNLEIMYQEGKGINQSYEEAVQWYRNMAEQGDAAVQNNLGWMYHIGLGVLQSDKEAVKWFTKSAEQGNPGAQYNLGIMNRNGFGVPQSYEEAIKWYKKSAEQGYALAKDFLGAT